MVAQAGEVRIKITHTALCHTDFYTLSGKVGTLDLSSAIAPFYLDCSCASFTNVSFNEREYHYPTIESGQGTVAKKKEKMKRKIWGTRRVLGQVC